MLLDSGLHADAPWKSMNIYQICLFADASCKYSSEGAVRGRESSSGPDTDRTCLAKNTASSDPRSHLETLAPPTFQTVNRPCSKLIQAWPRYHYSPPCSY